MIVEGVEVLPAPPRRRTDDPKTLVRRAMAGYYRKAHEGVEASFIGAAWAVYDTMP